MSQGIISVTLIGAILGGLRWYPRSMKEDKKLVSEPVESHESPPSIAHTNVIMQVIQLRDEFPHLSDKDFLTILEHPEKKYQMQKTSNFL